MANARQWAESVQTASVVRAPYGGFTYPWVHETDIAEVAVAALLDDRHHGAVYTVSGPAAISQIEQARLIGAAIGRDVPFQELDRAQTHALWSRAGWTADAIDHQLFLLSEFADEPAPVGTTITDLLGRPPRTFAQWAAEHAREFR